MKNKPAAGIDVRPTRPQDFDGIIEMARAIYPGSPPWTGDYLQSHLDVFAQGQLVAVEPDSGRVVGSASSLIVDWDDYNMQTSWQDFTDHGWFRNHNPAGRTLYGADVMVDPRTQGRGIGSKIYAARRELVRSLGLRRIRAGARLRGYARYKDDLSPEQYVLNVIRGELGDPTLSFQLKQGFRVIGVVRDYLRDDPESHGHAAVIEWVNHRAATRKDTYGRDRRFAKPRKPSPKHPPPPGPGDGPTPNG